MVGSLVLLRTVGSFETSLTALVQSQYTSFVVGGERWEKDGGEMVMVVRVVLAHRVTLVVAGDGAEVGVVMVRLEEAR